MALGGATDDLVITYRIDVADHGKTKQLLASERDVKKSVKSTADEMARQTAQIRRSATTAAAASTKRAAGLSRETKASNAATAATRRVSHADRAAAASAARRLTALDRLSAGYARLETRARRTGRAQQSGGIASSARGLARTAVAAGTAYLSVSSAKTAIGVTEDLAKTTLALHNNLNLSVEAGSRWAAVARARNIESKALSQTFGILGKNVEAAKAGTGSSLAEFKKLGITQAELKKMDFDQTLKAVADGMQELPAGTKRNTAAMKLFGRGWQTIVPVLRGGSKAMKEQLALADKYGVTFKGKDIKIIKELIAAQREAKFASMGLQVAFSTQVAPALTKAINAGSGFVRQMRDGTGAGGKFAKTAKDIARDLRPVGAAIKSAGKFLADHPRLVVAAAGAYAAFKGARGGLRVIRDLKDMTGAVRTASRAAAKSRIAHGIYEGAKGTGGLVKRALSGVGGTVKRIMARAGRGGGAAAAESIASTTGSNLGPALDRNAKSFRGGRWRSMGRLAGRTFGLAAAALAVWQFKDGINKFFSDFGNTKLGKILTAPGKAGSWLGNQLGSLLGTNRKRRGGRVRRFRDGGMVPILAAGGEQLIDRGRTFTIPGRDDRDGTLVWTREGSHVMTYDGQARMAAGASLQQAVASQAPHFAEGGVVKAFGQALRRTRAKPKPGLALFMAGIVESGLRNLSYGDADSEGALQLRVGLHGRKLARSPYRSALAFLQRGFTGRGGAISLDRRNRSMSAGQIAQAVQGSKFPERYDQRRVEALRYLRGVGSTGRTTTSTTSSTKRASSATGLIADAFSQGQQAGQAGMTRARLRREGNPIIAALREQASSPASSRGSTSTVMQPSSGGGGSDVARTRRVAARIRKPYVFGGGHAGFNRGRGIDCSGYVSAVAHLAGWNPRMRAPMATGGLISYGRAGRGRHVTIHVRNGGVAGGHTMLTIDGKGYSSGNRRTGRLSGRYDVSAAYLRTLPVKRHPVGMRAGGIVGRFAAGGTIGRPLSGRVRGFLSGRNSLEGLDNLIGRSIDDSLSALRVSITRRIRRGGSRKLIKRLESVVTLIDFELGRRVGRIQDVVEQRTKALERGRGHVDRGLRARGVSPDTSQGLTALGAFQAAETRVRTQNVASLTRALGQATAARNREAIREITNQLHEAQDELAESMVRQVELAREAIRAAAQEKVDVASWRSSMKGAALQRLELEQRLVGTYDSAGGAQGRADFIRTTIIPAIQQEIAALQQQAAAAAATGDASLARQIAEALYLRQNDVLQAMLDAQEQTAENTSALKEFGGSTAFSHADQVYTDLDVMKARLGV